MADSISNSDDTIDSRDVEERIDELDSERGDLESAVEEAEEALQEYQTESGDNIDDAINDKLGDAAADARKALADWDEDEEGQELKALKAFREEAEDYAPDWSHGATLIRESYWVEYCEQMLKDIGDLPQDLPGYIAIDWDKTADNLRVDYTDVEFGGITYLVR